MDILHILIGIILALAGGLVYYKGKAGSAGALLENLDTKNKVNQDNQSIAKDQGLLDAEAQKRQQAQQDAANKEKPNESNKDISDFFNK